jgi:hypothetical protein
MDDGLESVGKTNRGSRGFHELFAKPPEVKSVDFSDAVKNQWAQVER